VTATEETRPYVSQRRGKAPERSATYQIASPGDWAADGNCVGSAEPDIWHSDDSHRERESDSYNSDANLAIRICKTCPVQVACLQYALEVPQAADWGIWAGTTAAERRVLRRRSA